MTVDRGNPRAVSTGSISREWGLLGEVCKAFERSTRTPLDLPDIDFSSPRAEQVKKGKKFSVGLLENPADHCFASSLSRGHVRSQDRMSLAGSLFLWRKTLPSEPASFQDHRLRVTAPESALPDGYLDFVDRTCESLFPWGWDTMYKKKVLATTPPISACLEASRKVGGSRSTAWDRDSFVRATTKDSASLPRLRNLKFASVQCEGKSRAVTIAGRDSLILEPLHKSLYDQISSFSWCLRGSANPGRFKSFSRRSGEVFVSGDYESATDHLPLSSAETILNVAFRNSRNIPSSVKQRALESLRLGIQYPDGTSPCATRQLMGSLLCFPLLCVQNYCAFRWCIPRDVPVKINGDDIVFRATREEWGRWRDFVGTVGLRLSPGKTLVSSSSFSLNSTFFRAHRDGVTLIPVVRFCSLLRNELPGGLGSSFRSFLKGFRGEMKDSLEDIWVRRKKKLICSTGRSCHALGLRLSSSTMFRNGLWNREVFLTSLNERRMPCEPWRLRNARPVEGWERKEWVKEGGFSCFPSGRRTLRDAKREEKEFFRELVESCWTGVQLSSSAVEEEYWGEVKATGYEGLWRSWHSRCRRQPRFVRALRLRRPIPATHLYRLRAEKQEKRVLVWVRKNPVGGCRCDTDADECETYVCDYCIDLSACVNEMGLV